MSGDREADRAALLGYLDVLADNGGRLPCRAPGSPLAGAWTSDNPEAQARAAVACIGCAGLNACDEYGLTHLREYGVYGGRTDSERTRASKGPRRGLSSNEGDPPMIDTTNNTTTTHRPGCARPGWDVEASRTRVGIVIARCTGCGAVELRKDADQ